MSDKVCSGCNGRGVGYVWVDNEKTLNGESKPYICACFDARIRRLEERILNRANETGEAVGFWERDGEKGGELQIGDNVLHIYLKPWVGTHTAFEVDKESAVKLAKAILRQWGNDA